VSLVSVGVHVIGNDILIYTARKRQLDKRFNLEDMVLWCMANIDRSYVS